MKTAIFILLIIISFISGAQIPKKANTIIIAGTISQDDYTKQINTLLFENGYGIFNADPAQGTITTREKAYKRGSIRLTFLVKDNKVVLRGQLATAIDSFSQWSDIQYFGMKGSPTLEAWNEMAKIAEAIPGDKEYLLK